MKFSEGIAAFAILALVSTRGVTLVPDVSQEITITGGECRDAFGGPYYLPKSYDNNPDTFYHSALEKIGWAEYNIPDSIVTKVRLLNRKDCCEELMTNIIVQVCSFESVCTVCGMVRGQIGRGQWAELLCGDRISGNVVRVSNPNSYLQIAEIDIYGIPPHLTTVSTTTPEPTVTTSTTSVTTATTTTQEEVCKSQFADLEGQLDVDSCESMEVKDESRACQNLFDGSLGRVVKDGVCFVTKSSYKGWLEVRLTKTSLVSKVVLLSKSNGDGLAGTIVSVCVDVKKNCQRFGKIYKVKPDKCTVLKGDQPISGNMVRFYIADSSLAICELRIYGQ